MTDIDALLKNKHTPGPWQVSGGRNRPDIYGHMVGPDGNGIACVAYSDRTNADHVASLADARLIAAAPDLLDALTTERAKVTALQAAADGMAKALEPFASETTLSLVRNGEMVAVKRPNPAHTALTAYQQVRGGEL